MQNRTSHRVVFAALACSVAFLVSISPVRAAPTGNYVEASVGLTRTPSSDSDLLPLDSNSDVALGVTWGTSLSENTRAEAEFAYQKMAWDTNAGDDVTIDGFNVGANFLYDVGAHSSPAKLEIGIGIGWFFSDEVCLEDSESNICIDTDSFGSDSNDWNIQGILGGSYAISDTGAIVARYRTQNIGGFSSEERVYVFTVGYRHHF